MVEITDTVIADVLKNVHVTPYGCWVWKRGRSEGYGVYRTTTEKEYVHRIVYRHFKGEIPVGHEIDHVCCNCDCDQADAGHAATCRARCYAELYGDAG